MEPSTAATPGSPTTTLRAEWPHPLGVFLLLFGVYFLTSPRTVALEDDGIFVLASYFLGIGHPPGYPLYTLAGKLFTYLPFGSIAFRVHLSSAFFAAATCALLWWGLRLLVPGRAPAYAAALGYGLSGVFWSQAIIAEVYTLNTFFFFLLFVLCLQQATRCSAIGADPPTTRARLQWIAFVYGLSLCNHLPIMVLSAPALLVLLWPCRRVVIGNLHRLVLATLLGLTPYLWLVVRSQMEPEISFYGPLASWETFWFFFSRQGYAQVDTSASAGVLDGLQFAAFITREFLGQFTVLGAAFIGLGFFRQWRDWSTSLALALTLAFVASSFFLLSLVHFDYTELRQAVFRVYPLVAYGVMAVWLGLGVRGAIDWLAARLRSIGKTMLTAATVVTLVATTFFTHLGDNNRADYSWSETYAKTLLGSLEKNAVLFAEGDIDVGVLGYFNLIEGFRPDITLYNNHGLVFSTRLFPVTGPHDSARTAIVREFVARTDRPVYFTRDLDHDFASLDKGLYRVVDKQGAARTMRVALDAALFDYFERVSRQDSLRDAWTIYHRNDIFYRFGTVIGLAIRPELVTTDPVLKHYFDIASRDFYGRIAIGQSWLQYLRVDNRDLIAEYLNETGRMIDAGITKNHLALFFSLQALLHMEYGKVDDAVATMRQSLEAWPTVENPALLALMRLYAERGDARAYATLRQRFFDGAAATLPAEVRAWDRRFADGGRSQEK